MAIDTQIITGRLSEPDGDPITTGSVRFALSKYDATDNGVIAASRKIEAELQADGSIALELWPNTAGLRGTTYLVELISERGYPVETYGRIQVGEDGPYSLADLLREELPPATTSYWSTLTQAEYDAAIEAVELSQAWAEGTEPGGPGTKSAQEHAEDAGDQATAAATSAAQAALYDGVWLDNSAAIDTDETLSYGPGASGVAEGDTVQTREDRSSFRVLAEGADPFHATTNPTGYHRITAGGVKLEVLPGADGAYNVLAFNADSSGVTDSSAAFQLAVNTVGAEGCVIVPDGAWWADNVYIDHTGLVIDCQGVFDRTGNGNPIFIIGQQANGTPSTIAKNRVIIKGLTTSGDRTVGSKAVFFRKASYCKLVDCRLWGLDVPFDGDGEVGSYESICCEFHNIDLRGNTIGFNDPAGSFQGSQFFGGRIEQNQQQGIYSTSRNIKFIGTTIEGNSVADGTKPEISYGAGGILTLSECYIEVAGGNTVDCVVEVFANAGASGDAPKVQFIGGEVFANNAASRYLVKSESVNTQGYSFLGGQYTTFKNWVSAVLSGNSEIVVLPAWADAQRLVKNGATFGSGSTYLQYDRASGLHTNSNANIGSLLAVNGLDLFNNHLKNFFVNGNTAANQTVLTAAQRGSATVIAKVTGIGRASSSGSSSFVAYVTIEGNGTLSNTTIVSDYLGSPTALTFAMSGGDLQAQNLSTSRNWNFVTEIIQRA